MSDGDSNEQPLVTAVLVTGLHPRRYELARVAAECFLSQTHANKELLILNHGETRFDLKNPQVRELQVTKRPADTVGDLRNIGLAEAKGQFIINWDDDDWHSPTRIAAQLA